MNPERRLLITVVQLGIIDYGTGLRLQQRLVELRKQDAIADVLLLLEHTPVITLGRNAKVANVLASAAQLAQRGIEVFECDRGGDVTFHGPGQLVGYPIFDLRAFKSGATAVRKTLGAVEYVRRLEQVLIRTCADFGISSRRISGLTGVWTEPRSGHPEAKIAAIGVHISRAVTSHGFALNIDNDLDYFNLIIPCGITAKPVTSMSKELVRSVSRDEVAQSIARNFGEVFETNMQWAQSLQDLTNSVGVPIKVPENLRRVHKEEDTSWA
jgi:lipoyl(octanoyl) transferase